MMPEPLLMFTDDEKGLIWRTKANGCPDDDFDLFLHMAQRCGLDPRANQLYIVKRGGKWTIQTGIDGFRLIADRTGKYAGSDDAEMIGETECGKYPASAKVTVYKMVEGQRCPFSATARWSEYYPGPAAGGQWHKMPCVMLGKVAEALALRKAFPADLSGLYTDTEMDQAGQSSPQVLPEGVSAEEKARNAGLYFRRTVKGDAAQFNEFKAACEKDKWPDVALDAEQRGIVTFNALMRFAKEGEIPAEEGANVTE